MLYFLLVGVAIAASGSGEFSAAVNALFADSSKLTLEGKFPNSQIVTTDAGNGKPYVVFVTQPWCGACKNLKGLISAGTEVQSLMKDFNALHIEGDAGAAWQEDGHGYVPQNYFYDAAGKPIDIKGPNPSYGHFFGDERSLAEAMKKALAQGKNEPAKTDL